MRPASSLSRNTERTTCVHQTIPTCGTFSTPPIHARQVKTMLEKIKAGIEAAVPGCIVEIIPNASPSGQHSLLIEPAHAVEAAKFLRESADLRLDYCSNVSGVDWPDKEISEKVKVKTLLDGVEQEIEEVRKRQFPGHLEAV